MGKRVWVLGAGFSKSLGGPLLTQLFSQAKRQELRERLPQHRALFDSPEAQAVYALFAYGTRYAEGWFDTRDHKVKDGGIDLWRDAEHFLDYLDAARSRPTLKAGLERLALDTKSLGGNKSIGTLPNLDRLNHVARQLLAAECSVFLEGNEPPLESWHPYTQWARALDNDDTVVTFNYDLVVERALGDARSHVVLPGQDNREVNHQAKQGRAPVLIKLHGSVDWAAVSGAAQPMFEGSNRRDHVLSASHGEPLGICTPGAFKREMTNGPFLQLWQRAEQLIQSADAVIFIGYRFPPSDAESRHRLLSAVSNNHQKVGHLLNLHIVLGCDAAGDAAARRMKELLTFAALRGDRVGTSSRTPGLHGIYDVRQHALFAEDFLAVAEPGRL